MDNQKALDKIRNFYKKNLRMPSYSEIAELLNFKSKSPAQYLINKWITEKIIQKDKKGKLLPGKSFYQLKVLGTVKAGFPSPAEEENSDTISLDEWLIEDKNSSFMLKVSGDSMIEAGIMPGDTIIISKGKSPKNKDIVVAEVDHEWTLKYFYKQDEKIILIPANKKYKPIIPKEELKIAGVVTSVIRKMF